MAATTVNVQMQQRRDTAANWTSANPTLLSGELGFETDTYKYKLGDGTTAWNSLAYASVSTDKIEEGNTEAEVVDTPDARTIESLVRIANEVRPRADRPWTGADTLKKRCIHGGPS